MKEKLKFPGVPVYFNCRSYYIPSLSTRQYQDNQGTLENLPRQTEGESNIAFVVRTQQVTLPIILIAIQRNYPDVTADNLLDWLDAETHMRAWAATQNASGMTPVSEGEDLPAAETSTGAGSTGA